MGAESTAGDWVELKSTAGSQQGGYSNCATWGGVCKDHQGGYQGFKWAKHVRAQSACPSAHRPCRLSLLHVKGLLPIHTEDRGNRGVGQKITGQT